MHILQVKLSRKAHIPINIAVNTFGFHLVSMETNVRNFVRFLVYTTVTFSPHFVQVTIASLGFESVHWDSSAEKHQVLLLTTDKSLHAEIKTRMVRDKPVTLVQILNLLIRSIHRPDCSTPSFREWRNSTFKVPMATPVPSACHKHSARKTCHETTY